VSFCFRWLAKVATIVPELSPLAEVALRSLRIETGPVIVVSHGCDLEFYKGQPKRQFVELSPLIAIPKFVQGPSAPRIWRH